MARNRKAASEDAPKFDDKDRPWISNYPPLKRWLDAVNARCITQVPSGPNGVSAADGEVIPMSYIEQWLVNGCIVVIEVKAFRCGWELWTALASSRVDDTLVDAGKRCAIAQPEIVAATACREPDEVNS